MRLEVLKGINFLLVLELLEILAIKLTFSFERLANLVKVSSYYMLLNALIIIANEGSVASSNVNRGDG